MARIIDIPYGTYLADVVDLKISEKYIDLTLEIVFGAWRGYFAAKDRVISKPIPSGAYRTNINYVSKEKEVLENAIGENRTVVAIIVGETKVGKWDVGLKTRTSYIDGDGNRQWHDWEDKGCVEQGIYDSMGATTDNVFSGTKLYNYTEYLKNNGLVNTDDIQYSVYHYTGRNPAYAT